MMYLIILRLLKKTIWEPNDFLSIFKKKETKTSAGFLNPNPSFFGKNIATH